MVYTVSKPPVLHFSWAHKVSLALVNHILHGVELGIKTGQTLQNPVKHITSVSAFF